MIENENQYNITRQQLHNFEEGLYEVNIELDEYAANDTSNEKQTLELIAASFYSQMMTLQDEIIEYEQKFKA